LLRSTLKTKNVQCKFINNFPAFKTIIRYIILVKILSLTRVLNFVNDFHEQFVIFLSIDNFSALYFSHHDDQSEKQTIFRCSLSKYHYPSLKLSIRLIFLLKLPIIFFHSHFPSILYSNAIL